MDKQGLFMKAASLGLFALAIIGGSFSLEDTLDGYFLAPVLVLSGFLSRLMEAGISYYLAVGAFIVLIVGLIKSGVMSAADAEKGARWIVLFLAGGAFSFIAALVIGTVMLALGVKTYGIFLFLSALALVFSTDFPALLTKLFPKRP